MNEEPDKHISWLPELRFFFYATSVVLGICDVVFLSLYFKVWLHFGDNPNPFYHDLLQDKWETHWSWAGWSTLIGFLCTFYLFPYFIASIFSLKLRTKPFWLCASLITFSVYVYNFFFGPFEWFND